MHHFPDHTGAGQSIQKTESNVLLRHPNKIHLEIDEIQMPENVEFTVEATGRNRLPKHGIAENRAIFRRKF